LRWALAAEPVVAVHRGKQAGGERRVDALEELQEDVSVNANVVSWEAVAMSLAAKAAIDIPEWAPGARRREGGISRGDSTAATARESPFCQR
jgi:hypothetical protein